MSVFRKIRFKLGALLVPELARVIGIVEEDVELIHTAQAPDEDRWVNIISPMTATATQIYRDHLIRAGQVTAKCGDLQKPTEEPKVEVYEELTKG